MILDLTPAYILFGVVFGIPVLLLAIALFTPTDHAAEFRKQCKAQGMDFKETQAAAASRLAYVQLRRMTSDLCVHRHGDIGRQHIDDIAGRLALGLTASHGFETAKTFAAWIASSPDHEILYADAMKVHVRHLKRGLRTAPIDPQLLRDIKDSMKVTR